MRKIVWLVAFVVLCYTGWAQSTSNYTFTNEANGSLYDLNTGFTSIYGGGTDSYTATVRNIGFDFVFMGTVYTQFSCNPDGQIRLGNVPITGHTQAAASGVPYIIANNINGFLSFSDGTVRSRVFGTAPNRVLVIEWRNVQLSSSGSGSNTSTYQAALFETTGAIRFIYGTMFLAASSVQTNSIGFSSSNVAGTVASVNTFTSSPAFVTNSTSYSTVSISNNAAIPVLNSTTDGSRRVFTFTPPASVNAATAATTPINNITVSSMRINWNDASNEVGYDIRRSTDNINFTTVGSVAANATSFTATDLQHSTQYFWQVVSKGEGTTAVLSSAAYQATTAAPSFSGTVTVPGTYTSITAAINAIAAAGLSGATIINLGSTYVSSAEPSFPITIPLIQGNSTTNTLTIRPAATGLTIGSTTANAPTISLNGSRNVILDGRVNGTGSTVSLVIRNTSGSGAAVVFQNDACNNTVRYVSLATNSTASASAALVFGSTTGTTGNDNNLVEYNLFGAAASGYTCIYALGNTTAALNNSDNTISNNNFASFSANAANAQTHGVFIEGGNTAFTISSNSFYQTSLATYTTDNAGIIAIRINNVNGNGFVIRDNFIGGTAANAGGSAWAQTGNRITNFTGISLAVGSTTPTTVDGNTIARITIATNTTTPIYGIHLVSGSATIGGTVGNQIGGASTAGISVSTNSSTAIFAAISSGSTNAVSVTNNRILGISTSSTTGAVSLLGIQLRGNSGTTVQQVTGNTIGNSTATLQNSTNATTVGIIVEQEFSWYSVSSNTVQHLVSTNTGNSASMIGISAAGSNNTISSNMVRLLSGASASTDPQVVGIFCRRQWDGGSFSVSGNTVHSLQQTVAAATNASVVGIHFSGQSITTGTISKNFVHSLVTAATGNSTTSYLRGISLVLGSATIVNNKIRLGITPAGASLTVGRIIHGIHSASVSSGTTVFNNSVFIGGSNATGTANSSCYFKSSATLDSVRNNIFVNNRSNAASVTALHYCIISNNADNLFVSNSLLHGTGTGFHVASVSNGSSSLSTHAAYLQVFSNDGTSVFSAPGFVNATGDTAAVDLRITGTTPVESAGIPLAVVSDDFEGTSRGTSGGFIDLGADEGTFTSNDLSAPTVLVTQPASMVGTAGVTITATITDFTGATPTVSGFSSIRGVLVSGTSTSSVWRFELNYASIPGEAEPGNGIQYYIAVQDTRSTPNMTTFPAGASGMTNVNNITTPPSRLLQFSVVGGSTWLGTVNSQWRNANNWSGGVIPDSTDVAQITNFAANMPVLAAGDTINVRTLLMDTGNVVLNGASVIVRQNVVSRGSITVNSGTFRVLGTSDSGIHLISPNAAVVVNGGSFTIGQGNNESNTRRLSVRNGATVTIADGTLTVEGAVNVSGANFHQTGGNIVIDVKGSTASTSSAGLELVNGNFSFQSGNITFVDPASGTMFRYSNSQRVVCGANHTFTFGDGVSTQGGNWEGFTITNNSIANEPAFIFNHVVANGRGGVSGGRFLNQDVDIAIAGNFIIQPNSVFTQNSRTVYFGGNVVNNGHFISGTMGSWLRFEDIRTGVRQPVARTQLVSGTGTWANDPWFFRGHITMLRTNNTSDSGVVFTITDTLSFVGGSGGTIYVDNGKLTIPNLKLSHGWDNTVSVWNPHTQLNVRSLTVQSPNGAVTLAGGGNVNVYRLYHQQVGNVTMQHTGILVMKATDSSIARFTYAAGTITGTVGIEAFVKGGNSQPTGATPAARGFRFLGNPFVADLPIAAFIENELIDVTGPGGSANGFTHNPAPGATNSPSAFWYDPTRNGAGAGLVDAGWVPFTRATGVADGVNHNLWKAGEGIRILFRGSQGQGLNYVMADANTHYTVNPVTIQLVGNMAVGPRSFTLPAPGAGTVKNWSLVGNPYASPINIGQLLFNKYNGGSGGIGATAYVYNPNKQNTTRGGYDAIDISQNAAYILPTMG
ncbi:MAG: hypothetical protein EAZ47_04810, partial [Bacteroidetes bacterium]